MQRPSLFFLGVVVILGLYCLGSWGVIKIAALDESQVEAIYYSGVLATLNILGAFIVLKVSILKDQKEFARIFLAGMAGRLLFLAVIIFVIFKFTQANHFVFIASLFILYFIFQIWEVFFINANYNKGN